MQTTTQAAQTAPAYIRPAGVAKRYSVSERTVRDWQRRGILPFHKPSRKVTLFSVAECDRAMLKFRVNAIGEEN